MKHLQFDSGMNTECKILLQTMFIGLYCTSGGNRFESRKLLFLKKQYFKYFINTRMNVFELGAKTENEELALIFAGELGLANLDNRLCVKCNAKMTIEVKYSQAHRVKRWRCINRNCRASTSLLTGTIFAGMRIPISTMMRLLYFFSMDWKVVDALLHCAVSSKTAVLWYKIFRRVCYAYQMSISGFKIGGTGMTVEMDETYVCKRKYNRGRVLVAQSVWLVGGICRENGRIFLKFVTRRDETTLRSIILDSVEPGTRIITDCWRGYLNIGQDGYWHATVNHSYNFVSPEDPLVHTQRVERLWRSIKNFIPRNARREFLESYGAAFITSREIGKDGKLVRFNNFVRIVKLFFC